MKSRIIIVLLFQNLFCFSQQAINNLSLDTLGTLKWSVTYMSSELELEIQQKQAGKWVAISKTGHQISYIQQVGAEYNPPAVSMTFQDSCKVPLNKGVNTYRLVMTVPAKIESKEVSVNLFSTNNKQQLFADKDNYIRFDKGVFFYINDAFGNEVWKPDTGRMINTSKLKVGLYYIIVNGNIYEFYKK